MATVINPQVAGTLATAIACQTVQKLVDKGIIEKDDGFEIYARAVGNLGDPAEQEAAKQILRGLMPGIVIP